MGRGMVSNNEFKLDLIGIDNSAHARYIVAVNAYLFRVINMSINKDDFLKFDDNSQSNLWIINYDIETDKWDDNYKKEFNNWMSK